MQTAETLAARPTGMSPQLVLKGKLIARGYGIGAVVQVTAEVTAWEITGTYALLGTTNQKAYVLSWAEQQYVHPNPNTVQLRSQ